jgi:hypothetical protein
MMLLVKIKLIKRLSNLNKIFKIIFNKEISSYVFQQEIKYK